MKDVGTSKCPFCSFCPTSMSDFCDKHRPRVELPGKECQNCGHPRKWHDNMCWGNPSYKGICAARCKRFKGKK